MCSVHFIMFISPDKNLKYYKIAYLKIGAAKIKASKVI